MGTNAVSHHPPGSQLSITVLLFLTDQPANPSQQATVKIYAHLDNAVTLHLKGLSFIVRSESSLCFLLTLSLHFFCHSQKHGTYKHKDLFMFFSIHHFSSLHTLWSTSIDRSPLSKYSVTVTTFLSTWCIFFLPLSLPFLPSHV